jgi:hypothetical protein
MEHLAFCRCTTQDFDTLQVPGHIFYAYICAKIACLEIISVSKNINCNHEVEMIKMGQRKCVCS